MLECTFPELEASSAPYLVLEVRRDYIVADTLQQISAKLEVWPCHQFAALIISVKDLKKPLKIKYAGEHGVDLGGASICIGQ